jgi:hypothetical protein
MSTLQNTDVFAVTRGTDTYKVSFADVVAGVPIPSVLTYQGTADPAATAPAPAGGLKAGMVYVLTPAGTLEASWTGIGGKHADDGQLAIWEGAKWELVGNTGAIPAASDSVLGLVQLADAAAITAGTATRVVDAAQLKAAVDAENLWDRTGTTLTTKTAGDKVAAAALPAATTAVAGAVQLADAAAVTVGTAGRVVDAAQLKAAVAAEDLWDRTGTEITTKTAGDSVFTSGAVKVGGTTAAPNITLKADGGITSGSTIDVTHRALPSFGVGGVINFKNYNNNSVPVTTSYVKGFLTDGGVGTEGGGLAFGTKTSLSPIKDVAHLTNAGDFLLGGTLPASPAATIASTGKITVGTGIITAEQCWAGNTDAAYVITKANIPTNATTPIFKLTVGGVNVDGLASCRGILDIYLEVRGEGGHDITGAGNYKAAYAVGTAWRPATASIVKVVAAQHQPTQDMTVSVAGSVVTFNLVLGGFSPNHNVSGVTAYIRCPHKNLAFAAA